MSDRLEQRVDEWLKLTAQSQEESVPRAFHEALVRMLENLPERDGRVPVKPRQPFSRSKKYLLAAASAAVIVTGLAAGTYVSPTFAEWIKSFFTRPELDKGWQAAAQQGFSQLPQAAVTDQGITLKVMEVLADTKRLIFTYSLEKTDGTPLDPTSIFQKETYGRYTDYYIKDRNNFYLTDEKGNVVSESITYGLLSGQKVTQSFRSVTPHDGRFADVSFYLKPNVAPKQIYLNILLKKVDGVDGTWSLKVPVDLEKSIAATMTVPVNATYTTPSGLVIELEDVTYSPTVTTFRIRSEWTGKALQEMRANHPEYFVDEKRDRLIYHSVHYDVVDETGKVVATTDPAAYQKSGGELFHQEEIDPNDRSRGSISIVSQSFAPLDRNKTYKLVLRGIARTERPMKAWKVNLKDLENQQASFAYKDFRAAITGIRYGEESSILEMEQEVTTMGGDFEVLDEAGNVLPIKEEESKIELGEPESGTMMRRIKVQLPVEGLTQKTQSITLRLRTVSTFDRNVDWQVEIPPRK
ncbi:DUF4179 domain-containing protein [Brevibacillus sp. SYP-B805]|uniref:DUF4179 domain-containing protein n=1 Tax=Brevibacillus sp. SYP-B805 TaxID=1578199 RepID=UPI0013EAFCCD|nr:DUF4179 domain-containing protein [Brevibacillus sp. SYP-B805]NGQ95267.1 DUF4179 domain-containing protein [Brevibacillus sp. SYP-B805]